jgi:hypothetical protein
VLKQGRPGRDFFFYFIDVLIYIVKYTKQLGFRKSKKKGVRLNIIYYIVKDPMFYMQDYVAIVARLSTCMTYFDPI